MNPRSWLSLAVLALGTATLPQCSKPAEGEPVLTFTATPNRIDGKGASSTFTLQAKNDRGEPGEGEVRISSPLGAFTEGSGEVTLTLAEGTATTKWSCTTEGDPACTGALRFTATWGDLSQTAAVFIGNAVGDDGTIPGDFIGGGSGGGGGGGGTPGSAGTATFTHGDVHLFGTLSEGTSGYQALASLSSPSVVSVGFESRANFYGAPTIRPTDNRVLYINSEDKLALFTPDPIKWDSAKLYWGYPGDPEANDELIDTPGCTQVDWFRIHPTTGQVVYSCLNDGNIRDANGNTYPIDLRALGHGDLMVAGYDLVQSDGTRVPLSLKTIRNIRAISNGFWIVHGDTSSSMSLAQVDASGTITELGTYATLPDGYSWGSSSRLDDTGDLFVMAYKSPADVVIRLPLTPGVADIVYSEANAPASHNNWYNNKSPNWYVKIHISSLFTGP